MALVIVDKYSGQRAAVNAPAERWVAITPSDTELLPEVPKAIHNRGTAGVATLVGVDGVEAVFYFTQGGTIYISPKQVKATGFTGGVALTALL